MFTVELAPMMQPRGVTVNCIHPGIIATKVLNQGWGGGGSAVEVTTLRDMHHLHHDLCQMCLQDAHMSS